LKSDDDDVDDDDVNLISILKTAETALKTCFLLELHSNELSQKDHGQRQGGIIPEQPYHPFVGHLQLGNQHLGLCLTTREYVRLVINRIQPGICFAESWISSTNLLETFELK
jgi:hypothetical protein